MAELRVLSTRASITPSRFHNVYHWGNFKGNPRVLMERYFDAFVYIANWGTYQLMLRLPRPLLDPAAVRSYTVGETLSIRAKGDATILEFTSDDEEGMGWVDDEEAEAWMPALLPLRAELAAGDWRALYLGWLADVATGLLDDEEIEPPVPPGLRQRTAAQATLATFLRISDDLLAVAASASGEMPRPASPGDLELWLADLPGSDKDALLLRLADNPAHAHAVMMRQFRQHAPPSDTRAGDRTVAALRAAAAERGDARRRQEAERKAAARARYLDGLAAREDELWREVDALIETKRGKEYDQAVRVLSDLRDLSAHQGRPAVFAARLGPLRERYAKRSSLVQRLDRAGLHG
jgi:hypothetical protein